MNWIRMVLQKSPFLNGELQDAEIIIFRMHNLTEWNRQKKSWEVTVSMLTLALHDWINSRVMIDELHFKR